MTEIPLLGYAPDLDPYAPGHFQSCLGYESTTKGWRLQRAVSTAASLASSGVTSLRDGLVSTVVDGTEVVHLSGFGGTADKALFRKAGSALVNCSRGTSYSGSTVNWSFSQYGNYTLATNLYDAIQIRDASTTTAFANSSIIPKAKIAFTFGPPTDPRTMLLHYNDGTDNPDGWWCSAEGGPTAVWTPNIATGAGFGRLLGAGDLTCGIGFRDMAIAFGQNQMWVGRVGDIAETPLSVGWQKVSDDIGCVGMYAAKVANGVLYFLGKGGLYAFDGSYPKKLEVPIQNWLISQLQSLTAQNQAQTQLSIDSAGQRLLLAIRSAGSVFSTVLSINLLRNAVGQLFTGSIYGIADNKYRYSLSAGTTTLSQEDLTVAANSSTGNYIQVNYLGDQQQVSLIRRVVGKLVPGTIPSSFGVSYAGAMSPSDAFSYSNFNATTSPWRADFLNATRIHSLRLMLGSTNGGYDPEIESVLVDLRPAGME